MRIVCPSCEAEYEIPDAMLAGGPRKVRCARCAREWQLFAPPPPPPAPEPVAPPRVEPSPAAADALVEHAPPLRAERREAKVAGGPPSVGLVIAWLLTGALLLAGIGVLWLKRPEIVAFWPPARRLFILLGLD